MAKKKGGVRLGLSWLAFWVALAVPAWFAIAALGTRNELWDWTFGFGKMTIQWGLYVVGAAAILAVIAFIVGLIAKPRFKPALLAFIAALIVALTGGRFFGNLAEGLAYPPIHDIQTDWSQPIEASAELNAAREAGGAANPIASDTVIPEGANGRWPGMGGKTVAEAQAEGYPEIKPLLINAPVDVVFSAASASVEEMGWEIVTSHEDTGRIEATEASSWYGFKDDVMIRITPQGDGSRVDVRSTSRVGLSDLGANAARVENLLKSINSKLDVS